MRVLKCIGYALCLPFNIWAWIVYGGLIGAWYLWWIGNISLWIPVILIIAIIIDEVRA
jgi:hypothetical protein